MKILLLHLLLLILFLPCTLAQSPNELATQLTQEYETKHGISLTDYQRERVQSNYLGAIDKLQRIQHLQSSNPMLFEQKRQRIVADVEVYNSRLLTGNQMRQINAGKSSIQWPGRSEPQAPESSQEEWEEETVEEVDLPADKMPTEEVFEEEWEEEDWEESDWEEESEEGSTEEGDILDKTVDKLLATGDSTSTDSSKGKKVLKKSLKFLYKELLRPALDKSLEEKDTKEEKPNN